MKKIINNINLTCILQKDDEPMTNKCINGVLTFIPDGIRFEEEAKNIKPRTRNPKLYDGRVISLVRKPDNTIQFAFKSLGANFNSKGYARKVFREITNALQVID